MKIKVKFYNILLVISTVVTVTTIIYINKISLDIYPYEEIIIEVENSSSSNKKVIEEKKNEPIEVEENIINKNSLKDNTKETREEAIEKEGSVAYRHKIEEEVNAYRHKEEDESRVRYNPNKKIIKDEEAVSVFKVDRRSIVDNIGLSQKAKLMYIASKLSKEDYKKLYDLLKNSNPESAIKNSYMILRDNLSKDDFEEVKDILSEYINMEVVEKQI